MARSREERIVAAFVKLSDALMEDYDTSAFLAQLLDELLGLLDVAAGGVWLRDEGGLRVLASSDEDTEVLEVFELQAREGPCFDAFETGEPVLVPDLAAAVDRWPAFAPEALRRGWGGAYAFPLNWRDHRIGALNLFGGGGELSSVEVDLARSFADVATMAVLQQRILDDSKTEVAQLQRALDSRVVIEQAKGRIRERSGLEMNDAFALLRRYARSRGEKLSEVARGVAEGDITVDELRS